MYRVVLLTCALLAQTSARVLERCELARELSALGVRPDHLSTWVCIAFHESRFDTNANNPYSGDHGIFQISELYWCGAGKACGLPCHALHDEDISDDLDCALIVHEEHTRLQGNGFLAWVVYPQHCKHNTKKYLVDCDLNYKNLVPLDRARGFQYANRFDPQNVTTNKQNIENLLPPYLSVGKIVRENYGKVLHQNNEGIDWYNYKFDKIDELKLPVFNQPSQHLNMPPPTIAPRPATTTTTVPTRRTTTATTELYVPRVKVWRVIESNQFRKKKKFSETSAEKVNSKPEYDTESDRYTETTKSITAIQLPSTTIRPQSIATTTTTTLTPRVTTTTMRPTTKATVTNTTYRLPTSAFTYRPSFPTTTYRPPTSYHTPSYRPTISTTTYKTLTFATTDKPFSLTTYTPSAFTTTYKPTSALTRQWKFSSTTRKPTTTAVAPSSVTTTSKPSTTTVKPSTTTTTTTTTRKPTTAWAWSSTTSKKPESTAKSVTTKPQPNTPWYTFTSRTSTTSVTERTTLPFTFTTKTQNKTPSTTTKAVEYSTNKKPPITTEKPKTTQSIFDLYLNPTKASQLPSYRYTWGQAKLKIFAGGTTTTPVPVQTTVRVENSNGATKNYTKRQI